MSLRLVPLLLMLAVSLTQGASSVGPRMELLVHGHENASGHRIVTVDTRRLTLTENQWEVAVKVNQERSCGGSEIEQLVSVTSVFSPSHDSSMLNEIEPNTTATTPKSCPFPGYELFPGINCYKRSFNEYRNWSDARSVCKREGGDLMVVETEEEREEVYIPLCESVSLQGDLWIGVYIPQDGESWITVKGEPVPSTWWQADQPDEIGANCAWADYTGQLYEGDCEYLKSFICEIPL